MGMSYKEIYQMNPGMASHNLVLSYQQNGSIAATAREWRTVRAVVRKLSPNTIRHILRHRRGAGMEGKPPFVRLEELLDRKLPRQLALLPPVILDPISSDITLQGGTDLLATYKYKVRSGLGHFLHN